MNRAPEPNPAGITLARACVFLTQTDRDHPPPVGALFALGLVRGEELIAAVILGRPVPPARDEPTTIEITRSGSSDACAKTLVTLYQHAWRRARLRGYRRLITHTPVESRALTYGLRHVGLDPIASLPPRDGTYTPWRARTDRGVDGVCRTQWDTTRSQPSHQAAPAGHIPRPHVPPPSGNPDAASSAA